MKATRFDEVLGLVIKDIAGFTDMVNSPIFNKSARVTALWSWLRDNHNNTYSSNDLYIAAKGNGGLTQANYRMVLSDFVKLAEKFLLLKNNDLTESKRDELIDIFMDNGCRKSAKAHLGRLKQRIKKAAKKDTAYYNDKYMAAVYDFINAKQKARKAGLKKIDEYTDKIWLSMKRENIAKSEALGFGRELIKIT